MRYYVLAATITLLAGIFVSMSFVILARDPAKNYSPFRRAPFHAELKELSRTKNFYDILNVIGVYKNRVYFSTSNASKIVISDLDLNNAGSVAIKVHNNAKLNSIFYTFMDSANLFIAGGNVPCVFVLPFQRQAAIDSVPLSFFSRAAYIGGDKFVLRSFRKSSQHFIKVDLATRSTVAEKGVSESNKDGGIATDGVLKYDPASNSLCYVYYYKSEFIVFDTSLSRVARHKMVANITDYQITTTAIEKNATKKYTNTTPKRTVNAECAVASGFLYVKSNIKSESETSQHFKSNCPIDVYAINNGAYQGSIFVPDVDGKRVRRFYIFQNRLLCLYQTAIVVYELKRPGAT